MDTYAVQGIDLGKGQLGPAHGAHAAAAPGGRSLPSVERAVAVPADLHLAAAELEQFVREAGRNLSFVVDEVTGQLVISVRESDSGQLVRQIPSEEALRIARNLAVEGAVLVSELA
jgi:flagellar protein FlaG